MNTLVGRRGAFALFLSICAFLLARPSAAQGLDMLGAPPDAEPAAVAPKAPRAHANKPAMQLQTVELVSAKPAARRSSRAVRAAKAPRAPAAPVVIAAAPAPKAAKPAPRSSDDEGLVDLVERSPHRLASR